MAAPLIENFGAARGAAMKIFDVLDSKPVIHKNKNAGIKLEKFQSTIVFDNINFSYPSRPDVQVGLNKK